MITQAGPADVPAIAGMIRDLASYERAAEHALASDDDLHAALFGPDPVARALVALPDGATDTGPGRDLAGFALWFRSFSTWTGRPGVYLEDLYVRPEHRRSGHGRALLAALARICVERGYPRLEWSVLNWNEPALAFYRAVGATGMHDWTVHRVTGAALDELGRAGPG